VVERSVREREVQGSTQDCVILKEQQLKFISDGSLNSAHQIMLSMASPIKPRSKMRWSPNESIKPSFSTTTYQFEKYISRSRTKRQVFENLYTLICICWMKYTIVVNNLHPVSSLHNILNSFLVVDRLPNGLEVLSSIPEAGGKFGYSLNSKTHSN